MSTKLEPNELATCTRFSRGGSPTPAGRDAGCFRKILPRKSFRKGFTSRAVLACQLWLAIALSLTGCHRQFYRIQTDQEANALISEKNLALARPSNTNLRIEVDRRSRMFNPFDLDFQPMPIDDPAANQFMQCVDRRRGYPMWDAAGVTNSNESPDWWQFLPLDEDGVLVLNAETAVEVALLHSPEYQEQVETLYLSALAVSAQRFQFDTLFNYGSFLNLTADGAGRAGSGQSSTRAGASLGNLAMDRRFATGASLIASVANSITWELSGPNSQSALTILDFTLLQPLLRNAGRDIVLEDLTFAERRLLANVRSFERFRRSFFLHVTTGQTLESRPTLGGGNTEIAGARLSTNAGGFLGLLQTQLQIRNSEENIARLKESLLILEDSLIESLTKIPDDSTQAIQDRLQIEQARDSLVSNQANLIRQQAGYQRSLDSFLRTLGLPPYLTARIESPVLDRFELIDRDLRSRREELSVLRSAVGQINIGILEQTNLQINQATGLPEKSLEWSQEIQSLVGDLQATIRPLANFNRRLLESDLDRVQEDIARFERVLPSRQKQNRRMRAQYESQKDQVGALLDMTNLDESMFDISDLETLGEELGSKWEELSRRLGTYQDRIEKLDAVLDSYAVDGPQSTTPGETAIAVRDDIVVASQDLLSELGDDVLSLQLIQARARTESVVLPAVDLEPASAFELARKHRRDWANARAELVDAWRGIEVVADDLESRLDVVFSGSVQNGSNNPLKLNSNTGQLRVGLEWDAPLVRLIERNNYREQLIRYEQAKRQYYGIEDSVWQLLRAEIRQLQVNRLTFELGRQSVRISASQIELNEDRRAVNDARGRGAGPTAARDIITALDALLSAQNNLLDIYVSNEVVRRNLDFDLGTMELTPEGLWIEPDAFRNETLANSLGTLVGAMIECDRCGLRKRAQPQPPENLPGYRFGDATSAGDVNPTQAASASRISTSDFSNAQDTTPGELYEVAVEPL